LREKKPEASLSDKREGPSFKRGELTQFSLVRAYRALEKGRSLWKEVVQLDSIGGRKWDRSLMRGGGTPPLLKSSRKKGRHYSGKKKIHATKREGLRWGAWCSYHWGDISFKKKEGRKGNTVVA